MKAHFQRAIWPITATAAFFGLALIEYPLGKPQRFLSLIYAIVASSMLIGTYIMNVLWPDTQETVFVKSVVHFVMFSCTVINFASICLTHWHGKRYYKCMERLHEVDETLRHLCIETDYFKLRRVWLVGLVIWASVCFLLSMNDSLSYGRKLSDKRFAVLAFFMHTPLHSRTVMQMQFWSVLAYAGTRFDSITCVLRKLTINDNNHASSFRNSKIISVRRAFVLDETARRTIWTAMHLHFQLCKILRDINTTFESQMCLQMGFDSVFLLCNVIFSLRVILLPFAGDKFMISVVLSLWAVPYFVEIILINHLCETVSTKARNVCDMAVQVSRLMDDGEMRNDVSLLVLQTKLKPLRFSCLGLYYFGYHFIYKIFCSIVTNAVIILQLKMGLQPV